MAIAKRVVLFLIVNIAIVVTLSLVLNLLGIGRYVTEKGINYESLMAFCLVWGMGGAFISLSLSRIMAKWMMRVRVIPPNASGAEGELVRTIHSLARAARLPKMPEVGIYDSPEVNAFATGPTKSRALVAVSRGLLQRMNRDEIEGVLGHEIAHVANGDMVTMTLLQGVINAFVMFFARIAAFAITQALASRSNDSDSRPSPFLQFGLIILFEIVFGLIGALIVAAFSRYREFRADSGGARLAGREKMIGALRSLQRSVEMVDTSQSSMAAFKISTRSRGGLVALFSSHPPLETRIQKLAQGA